MIESKHTPAENVQRYLNMRNLKPLPQLGDIIHGIHFGTEYEAALSRDDVEDLWRQHSKLLKALELLVNRAFTQKLDLDEDWYADLVFSEDAIKEAKGE